MASFFKRLLLFLVFCSIAYFVLIIVWGTFLPKRFNQNLSYKISSGHTRFKEADTTKNVDILFLGSSHAYRGFDTRLFKKAGYKTFNLGSSSQTPKQTRVLLERYLEQINPKLIVYEVYSNTFTIDGVEATLRIIPNNPNLSTFGLVASHKHVKVLNTYLFSVKKKYFPGKIQVPKSSRDTYVSGGFVERKLSYFKHETFNNKAIKINNKQLEAFEESINMFEERNIPFILVQAPITKASYNAYTNNEYFDTLMREYGEYYNFNTRIKLDDSLHFYDAHHLNQDGVVLFNEKFINDILDKSPISP